MLAGAFLLALGGGWLVLRRRGLPLAKTLRTGRLLAIEETKSLGNRQYLVVAACEGRRFLLGVTPGQIQMLSPLDDHGDHEDTSEL
jgi:flagellar protein FliO/FliZ